MKEWLHAPLERAARKRESRVLRPVTRFLESRGVTPNMLTVGGLILQAIAALFVAKGGVVAGGGILLVAGLSDIMDGELARQTGQATPFGAFLDSMFDQYGDAMVFLGMLLWYMSKGSQTEVLLVFLALFGSMLNSHARSRGGMLGVDCKAGLMTRAERIPIMIAGLIFNQMTVVLWLLIVLNNFSAIQRIIYVRRELVHREVSKNSSDNHISEKLTDFHEDVTLSQRD